MSPSFIIIGYERCGTTSLYRNICRHSGVTPAYQKEIEFFDKHYHEGYLWYEQQFRGTFSGEATPTYVWNPVVPERIRAYNPNVKVIVILRTDWRAAVYSKYWQQVSKGVEKMSFEDAIKFEKIRTAGDLERTKLGLYPSLYSEYAYKDRYSERHLDNWGGFNILKVGFEDYIVNTDKAMSKVYEFLELKDETYMWDKSNKGLDYPAMTEQQRNNVHVS